MATAKKLPSGNYRVRIYFGTSADGKKIYKSFTAGTKKEAELLALNYSATKEPVTSKTFDEALTGYIESRSAVIAPSTLREYKRSQRCDFDLIKNKDIYKITQEDVQKVINEKAKKHSPKTVKNIHGLISAVFKLYRPEFVLHTTLPQKIIKDNYIPTDADIKKIISLAKKDSEMYIAILLAAFGPMRRSEICGLDSSDINGNIIHVQRAVVNSESGWVDKTTKSTAGNRFIPFPDFVINELQGRSGRIVHLKPNQISDRFIDLQKASGLPHFRFHDLRHYCASILHTMMPDAYIMQRGGWNSDAVLKQIYRHALTDQSAALNDKANEHFKNMYDTKDATK